MHTRPARLSTSHLEGTGWLSATSGLRPVLDRKRGPGREESCESPQDRRPAAVPHSKPEAKANRPAGSLPDLVRVPMGTSHTSTESGRVVMDKDPAEIVATLRRSIEVSQRGSRRLRAHRFKDLFGFQAWSPARREMVDKRCVW